MSASKLDGTALAKRIKEALKPRIAAARAKRGKSPVADADRLETRDRSATSIACSAQGCAESAFACANSSRMGQRRPCAAGHR